MTLPFHIATAVCTYVVKRRSTLDNHQRHSYLYLWDVLFGMSDATSHVTSHAEPIRGSVAALVAGPLEVLGASCFPS
jgi:hypothetical protein